MDKQRASQYITIFDVDKYVGLGKLDQLCL